MKRNNRRYSKISSIEQLRLERSKLELQIEHKELDLLYDWEYMRGLFTLDNLLGSAIEGLGLCSAWESIQSGWEIVRSLFGGRKKRRRRNISDCL